MLILASCRCRVNEGRIACSFKISSFRRNKFDDSQPNVCEALYPDPGRAPSLLFTLPFP